MFTFSFFFPSFFDSTIFLQVSSWFCRVQQSLVLELPWAYLPHPPSCTTYFLKRLLQVTIILHISRLLTSSVSVENPHLEEKNHHFHQHPGCCAELSNSIASRSLLVDLITYSQAPAPTAVQVEAIQVSPSSYTFSSPLLFCSPLLFSQQTFSSRSLTSWLRPTGFEGCSTQLPRSGGPILGRHIQGVDSGYRLWNFRKSIRSWACSRLSTFWWPTCPKRHWGECTVPVTFFCTHASFST
jgi:hypothetical protein